MPDAKTSAGYVIQRKADGKFWRNLPRGRYIRNRLYTPSDNWTEDLSQVAPFRTSSAAHNSRGAIGKYRQNRVYNSASNAFSLVPVEDRPYRVLTVTTEVHLGS